MVNRMNERWVTEDAAVVGLAPNDFPEALVFRGRNFARVYATENERGQLVSWSYRAPRGFTLEVLK